MDKFALCRLSGISLVLAGYLIASTGYCALMLNTLAHFDGTNGTGGTSLIQSSDGCFYGVSEGGGQYNLGTVFRLTPAGNLSAIASFDGTNGALPFDGLIQDKAGAFYGVTSFGGAGVTDSVFDAHGTIYRITTNGIITVLHSFVAADGAMPIGRLTLGSDGYIYGTTSEGGPYTNIYGVTLGTAFRVTTNGVYASLAAFNGTNGANPMAELLEGDDGSFYSTTSDGGLAGLGTVFRLTPGGTITTLVTFYGTNGAKPFAGLVQHRDGNFYGTTRLGGDFDKGTFFRMDANGLLTTLASFDGNTGAEPRATLTTINDSLFYGVTRLGGVPPLGGAALGTVFQVTTNGSITRLFSFSSDFMQRGAQPFCTLLKGFDACFYGTTFVGLGPKATVFRLEKTIPPVMQRLAKADDWVTLTWSSLPHQIYQVESTPTLQPPSWSEVDGATSIFSDGTNTTIDFPDPALQRYYRAVLRP